AGSAAGPRLLASSQSRLPSTRGGLNAAIASALRGPGDWSQLMAIVRENQAFRGRLASEVSPELLRRLLQTLIPTHGAPMAELADALLWLHEGSALAPADRAAFRRVLWECVLTEVARYHAAGFSLRSFFSQVLALLAARHSLTRSTLDSRIAAALEE